MGANTRFDLSNFAVEDGISLISQPQRFAGGEEAYDAQIGGALRDDQLRSGRGAWQLLSRYAGRPIETVMEIGAGGGTCSLGLVAESGEAAVLLTDTSPRFLGMIGAKLKAAGLASERISFATLAGEDLGRLPAESCDAIVIASALHHVGDWEGFLRDAAHALRPGGVMVIQEPCREGNLMMGMMLDMVLGPLWPRELALKRDDAERIRRCRDSIYHLADTHIPKDGEDKHNFLASELAAAADEAGFRRTVFYSNFHFDNLAGKDLARRRGTCSFLGYLGSFLEMHHGVSADGLAKLRTHLFPMFGRLEELFSGGDGAPLVGCMVFCR
jgi:ubiquinone/menaquinone biosynthesis C-methylase UbiE